MWKAFQTGIQTGASHWRVAFLVYLIQFLIAVIFGVQVGSFLETTIGDSLAFEKLLTGFDQAVVSDFLHTYRDAIGVLSTELTLVVVISVLLNAFLDAGMMGAVVRKERYWPSFFENGQRLFGGFLKMRVIITLCILGWTLLIWLPVLSFLFQGLEILPSERSLGWVLNAILITYLVGLLVISQIGLFARVHYADKEDSAAQALSASWTWVKSHFFPNTGLLLLFTLLQVAVGILYVMLESSGGMISQATVYGFLVIQQGYVFSRILIEMMTLGGASAYYLGLEESEETGETDESETTSEDAEESGEDDVPTEE